ncbi:sigma factor [Marinobacter gelidimuriae]|uniref:sigma factor n=1 Tax=Marinobacter gelidimuriae TaxID=2739064 RepID=UPI0003714269|nr:sigma factor [Marinobacter gelidimuriae]
MLVAVSREDRDAFQQLYQMVSASMFGLCLKLAGQRDLAEDALQEAFIQIWHRAREYHTDRGMPAKPNPAPISAGSGPAGVLSRPLPLSLWQFY